MNRATSFCGVILAAGESSRMGRDKALLPWPADSSRSTFLSSAMDALVTVTDLVIVVCGENEPLLRDTVYSRAGFLVRNPEPERGQFSSLRVGLQSVLDHGRDGAVVMLVDRPPVEVSTLRTLVNSAKDPEEQEVWAMIPSVAGQHGHPLVMGREMIEAMLRAPATSTAREVLAANQARVGYLEVNDSNAVLNLNTPEDYARAAQIHPGDLPH